MGADLMSCNKKNNCKKWNCDGNNNHKFVCKCICNCNKSQCCEWTKFPTCKDKCDKDLDWFLGRYVRELLENLDLPCGHPGIDAILRILSDGGCLPCGHPSLEELILIAILEDNKELCKVFHKHCCK